MLACVGLHRLGVIAESTPKRDGHIFSRTVAHISPEVNRLPLMCFACEGVNVQN